MSQINKAIDRGMERIKKECGIVDNIKIDYFMLSQILEAMREPEDIPVVDFRECDKSSFRCIL